MHRLIKQSDILVENFVPGRLASMGLGWEDCHKMNPRLIYTSITGKSDHLFLVSSLHSSSIGYGQTGPYKHSPGYDVVIEAEAGLMHMSAFVALSLLLC